MEFYNVISTPVHEEFFGNIVGAQSTAATTPSPQDYVTDWAMPKN